jgi:D-aminoacyl-tRNA deacylase
VIALLQRAAEAKVIVDDKVVGAIGPGLLVLLCAERGDDDSSVAAIIDKL